MKTNTIRVRKNRSTAPPAPQIKTPALAAAPGQQTNPTLTPQQRINLRTLEMSIDALASLLILVTQHADRGINNLVTIGIFKINDDFAAVRKAFNIPTGENIELAGGAR
jgi:hypothetical protein